MASHDVLGFVAAAFVLLTLCMPCMRSLRLVALFSNMAFIGYGWAEDLMPVLALHVMLVPINFYGLFQTSKKRRLVE